MMFNLTEKKSLAYIIILFFVVQALFFTLRLNSNGDVLVGEGSYYHLLKAQSGSINPYHLLLRFSNIFITFELASKVLPIVLGFVCLLLLFFALSLSDFFLNQRFWFSVILILSPGFVYSSIFSNQHILVVLLAIFGFLMLRFSSSWKLLSPIIFATVPLFGLTPTIVIGAALMTYSCYKNKRLIYLTLILMFIVLVVSGNFADVFITHSLLQNMFTDLGGLIGFSIFGTILAIIGFIFTWKNKRNYAPYYLLVVILFFYGLYVDIEANLYLNFFLVIFASIGFDRLLKRKWNVELVKSLTLLVLVLGLIFSGLSFIDRISAMPPDTAIVDSLKWLKDHSNQDDIIFSHYSNGFWIEYYANRHALTNNINYIAFEDDSETIFQSRNLERTTSLLDKYDIRFIWIDPDMVDGQVWSKDEQGLWFLFKNSETFKNNFDTDNIYIWKYIK